MCSRTKIVAFCLLLALCLPGCQALTPQRTEQRPVVAKPTSPAAARQAEAGESLPRVEPAILALAADHPEIVDLDARLTALAVRRNYWSGEADSARLGLAGLTAKGGSTAEFLAACAALRERHLALTRYVQALAAWERRLRRARDERLYELASAVAAGTLSLPAQADGGDSCLFVVPESGEVRDKDYRGPK